MQKVIFWFDDTSIKDINIMMNTIPRIGDTVSFPVDFVKYNDNITSLDQTTFKVSDINWQLKVFKNGSLTYKWGCFIKLEK